MDLNSRTIPFDRDDWLFGMKHDGFRSLAYIEKGTRKLVSRNDFDQLSRSRSGDAV